MSLGKYLHVDGHKLQGIPEKKQQMFTQSLLISRNTYTLERPKTLVSSM